MQGNSDVKAGLQQAITALCGLMCQYMLDAVNTTRLGMSIGAELMTLHDQSEEDMRDLVRWLYFFEGTPTLGPGAMAQTHADVTSILADATTAETAFVGVCAQLAQQCLAAGEFGVLHAIEHAIKFHTIGSALGSTTRVGHLAWLQKQNWQLNEFQETMYEQTKVIA